MPDKAFYIEHFQGKRKGEEKMKKKTVSLLLVAAMAATMIMAQAGTTVQQHQLQKQLKQHQLQKQLKQVTQQMHQRKKHGQERSKYGAHRKTRIQDGFPSSVMHLTQHIQTGM